MAEGPERPKFAKRRGPIYEERAGRNCGKWAPRSLVLGDDVWEKLSIDAVRKRRSMSRIADKLLYDALRPYVVSYRGSDSTGDASANPSDGVDDPAPPGEADETLRPPLDVGAGPESGAGEGGEAPKSRRKRSA
jgi:hypothetical protein